MGGTFSVTQIKRAMFGGVFSLEFEYFKIRLGIGRGQGSSKSVAFTLKTKISVPDFKDYRYLKRDFYPSDRSASPDLKDC